MKTVYIILVNWNGWENTIECLESLFRLHYQEFHIIVCDNDSQDSSLDKIKLWAEGGVTAHSSEDGDVRRNTYPPIQKPCSYVEYDRSQAELGGDFTEELPRLVLIRTGENLGFAGGCNVGLRFAMAHQDGAFFWLLNNDTVVDAEALSCMVRKLSAEPSAGMCGSSLYEYYNPRRIQTLGGGRYNRWLGIVRGFPAEQGSQPNYAVVEKRLDYISGASMLVSREFVRDIGLLCEDYFLYFEELDWAVRSRGQYTLRYAPDSIVYHKESASIGSLKKGQHSFLADYYFARNKILFTQKYFPFILPLLYCGLLLTAANRLRKGQWNRVTMIFRLMICLMRNMKNNGNGE